MQIVLPIDQPGSARVEDTIEPRVISNGQRILVIDPVTWSFLATLFIIEFTKGLATGLGEGVAKSILEGLGLIKRNNNEDMKKYFDSMAQRIILEVRRAVYEDSLRNEHATLAAAFEEFEAYIISPEARSGELFANARTAREVYHQLKSFPEEFAPVVVPGLIGAASLHIAYSLERLRLAEGPAQKSHEAQNARNVVTDVLNVLSLRVEQLKAVYDGRVEGPFRFRTKITCEMPYEPPVRVYGGLHSPEDVEFEAMRGGGTWKKKVDAIACRIDGVDQSLVLEDCTRKTPENQTKMENICFQARDAFAREFKNIFAEPLSALRTQGDALLAAIAEASEVEG